MKMTEHYTLTEEDMKTAHEASWRRFGYPSVREKITITLDTHPEWNRDGVLIPFVRMGAIPVRFHAAVNELGLGSTCPAPDDERDSLYTHDVYRYLRAIGVEAEFIQVIAPTAADDLQQRIDAANTKGSYAPTLLPLRETIQAPCYGTSETSYPYVFLADLPVKFHEYLKGKAIGSSCPAFRVEHKAYWLYDVDRWLLAIGVKLEATFEIHDCSPFRLPPRT
jgi:hypothetical protein